MRWLALALLAALAPAVAGAQGGSRPRVVAVKSANLAPYASVIAGFSAEARAEIQEVTLDESAGAAARVFKKLASQKPALVLALGPLAANAARRSLGEDVPVLFAMVPYYEKYGLEGPNVTGISLTSDLGPELEALLAVVPKAKRVGMVHDPRFSANTVALAQQAAVARGLTIHPLEVDSQGRVEKVLEGAAGRVDALIMVADKTVGTAAVVQALISFAQARRLPLVGLTPSQVKEGATLALSPSPLAIGLQAGRLANRIIHEKVDPGALAVAQPEGLDLSVNLSTARKLGPSPESVLELLRFAAKRDFAVKVYE
ncbi:ABC transporter substrate-binding protein [Myxococcus sp. K15C18031901]|uniref:ABC transporter substrate-binding protein n=1 Tax=Myxococcus dinghuensis TaxID=2906761 RepID=UPI0020A7AAB5|nr:ABC transporter substrate binding protein [Myxococcus dinghuensis]MCP3097257.1 ABC transporter substrate-binding protein [Myxococcus dinghuensis]